MGELVIGAGEADLESFDLAEPAFAFGFGDAGDEVVADLGDAVPLARRWPVHAATQATVRIIENSIRRNIGLWLRGRNQETC